LRAAAPRDLERAERELDASGHDCVAACRALASMERATLHLCSLTDDAQDAGRCNDARRRLATARSRVRSSCGACQ
jgi:hypothetical protein